MKTTAHLMQYVDRVKVLVVLDTMWGRTPGGAEPWFFINPDNHSGSRLYRMTQTRLGDLIVTNACRERTDHATKHGVPDPDFLDQNLMMLPPAFRSLPILICGKIAQETFARCRYNVDRLHLGPQVECKHPANRTWTKAELDNFPKLLKPQIFNTALLPLSSSEELVPTESGRGPGGEFTQSKGIHP